MNKFNRNFPNYDDDSDYNTNANSYYKDLGRKTKLIKLLAKRIWEYENTLNETLEQIEQRLTDYILENDTLMTERLENWDKRIDEMPEEMSSLFVTWLEDGTLEQIINHDVLGNKADKIYVDDELGNKADKTYVNVLNEEVNNQLTQTNQVLKTIHVNVKDEPYNAKGDGVTDDTQAIQQAIDDAGVSGGLVYIPTGTYLITDTLVISNPYVEIEGAGMSSVLMLNTTGVSGIQIGVKDFENTKVYGTTIKNMRTAGEPHTAIEINQAYETTIENVRITAATTYGIQTIYGWGSGFKRVVFSDMVVRPTEACFYFRRNSGAASLVNCYTSGLARKTKYGIHLAPNKADEIGNSVHGLSMTNCTWQGFSESGIYIEVGHAITISGNYFEGNNLEIMVGAKDGIHSTTGITIQGSRFTPLDGKPCIYIKNGRGVVIQGNVFPSGNDPILIMNNNTRNLSFTGNSDWGGDPQALHNRMRVESDGQKPQVYVTDNSNFLYSNASQKNVLRYTINANGTDTNSTFELVGEYEFPVYTQ